MVGGGAGGGAGVSPARGSPATPPLRRVGLRALGLKVDSWLSALR